jgi:hypothetical protein
MKYRTVEEYQQIVRNMPFKEVEGLVEIFKNCQTRTAQETKIMNVLEAEIERRFLAWEVVEV